MHIYFFANRTTTTEYAPIDEELIRPLYNTNRGRYGCYRGQSDFS